MARTKREKQQDFEQRMQTRGAEGFACGPRPWEHWDESGSQGENRVWEGNAQRIYPQQPTPPTLGDRLLSGFALIALIAMFAGIAGVYFSEPPLQEQAHTGIQPPPIVVAERTTRPATPRVNTPTLIDRKRPPDTTNLNNLSAPAAGIQPALGATPAQSPPLPSQEHGVVVAQSREAIPPTGKTVRLKQPRPAPPRTAPVVNKTHIEMEKPASNPKVIAINTPRPVIAPATEIKIERQAKQAPLATPATRPGNWVINLSAYRRKSTANRMLEKFAQQGVVAEIFEITVNDTPMYRIRMTGFDTSHLAKAEISKLEQQLDLDSVWVSRK